MRILVVGDFHGKFPKKFENLIKKEKIDLVISVGDYPPFHYRKLWFKHCYGKEIELWEIIGKQKYRKLVMEDLRRAEEVLKKLNKLPVPVYTVLGNIDYPAPDDVSDLKGKAKKSMPNWDKKTLLAEMLKKYKNIKRFDYSYFRFGEYIFIGMRGHSSPGKVKSKAYKKSKKKLDDLFRRFRKNKTIFVSHIVPYNTKLDKMSKKAHKKVRGKHYGSKLAQRIIKKHQPLFCFAGHFHENIGKTKIRNTIVINPGAAKDGKAAIIELDKGKVKKVKFVK